jgi:hypothetical protein
LLLFDNSFLDFSLVTLALCFSVVSTTFCSLSLAFFCVSSCKCFLPEGERLPYGVFSVSVSCLTVNACLTILPLRPRLPAEQEKKRGDFRALIISTFGNYQ